MASQEKSDSIDLRNEVEILKQELENTRKELAAVKIGASSKFSSIPELPESIDISDPFAVTFHTIIIFGAEGNLALKKTYPALFTLMRQKRLPLNIKIIGYARDNMTTEQFQKLIYRNIYNITHPQADRLQFLNSLSYIQGQFNDIKHFESLKKHVDICEKKQEDEWLQANNPSSPATSSSSSSYEQKDKAYSTLSVDDAYQAQELIDSNKASSQLNNNNNDHDNGDHDDIFLPAITANFRHIRTFYLAVPPFLYPSIAKCCHETGLKRNPFHNKNNSNNSNSSGGRSNHNNGGGESHSMEYDRFILEKPFGKDTETCKELTNAVSEYLSESQIYRIDHYLGKELVMNMLVMRFANICFNSIWDRMHIHSVHVICKETIGTFGRGGYFDEYGIIRDVMQNHLLQILALVGMEQPLSLSAEHIRQEKVKLLQSVQPLQVENMLIGQFIADKDKGKPGYLDDPTIKNKQSKTETYATTVLYINNPRWAGVPFILKAGKGLDESKVEIRIRFHEVPGAIPTIADCNPNELVIRVQPDECIYWKITSKIPGLDFNIETRRMDLLYGSSNDITSSKGGYGHGGVSPNPTYTASSTPSVMKSHAMMSSALSRGSGRIGNSGGGTASGSASGGSGSGVLSGGMVESPGAYERLILEVMRGDQTNFVHKDELLCSWQIFTPALHEIAINHKIQPELYKFNSSGPKSELEFSKKFGFHKGFAHDVDHEKRRQAIAWGKSTVNSDGSTNTTNTTNA